MKETKTIKQFVTEYNNRVPQIQETYIKDNLVITPYVPFNKKNVLADKLVDISTYVFEDYTKEDGTAFINGQNSVRDEIRALDFVLQRIVKEIEEIQIAIANGIPTYTLKYSAKTARRWAKVRIIEE